MNDRFRSACAKKLTHSFSMDAINLLKDKNFDPQQSNEGYVLIDSINETIFFFQYLRKAPFTYSEYQKELVVKKGETIKETFFEINLKKMMIVIYAGKAQSDFLIRKLESICGDVLVPFEIELSHFLNLISKSKYIFRFEQVEINNFNFNNLLVGKYIANIHEKELFKKIMEEYNANVSKITFSVDDYDMNTFQIKIDRNGCFTFNSFSETNDAILKYIISNLY